MPELPEVEHMRTKLDSWMRGHRIVSVTPPDARIVRPVTPGRFVSLVTGRRVDAVERRGKWLRLSLDDDQRVFVHLGMTGWFEQGASGEPMRFERSGFELERARGRTRVSYVDPRRWGRLWLASEDVPAWTALGPDPLVDGIDARLLGAKLARRPKRSIKEVLLDQSVLAGVGNIQAIEALWKAEIDPRSRASAIDPAGVKAIVKGLRWSIARTLADLAKHGMEGDSPFVVYGRKGSPCPRCKTPLSRIELGGRTTTFCRGCQRLVKSRAKPKA